MAFKTMVQKRIALVGFRLGGGGSDRVMANLSLYLKKQGYDVHIIIFHDETGFDYTGVLYNLGKLKSSSNTVFNKIKRFYHFAKYIKQNNFDYIIDFRFRKKILQEFLISRLIYKKKGIYTVHSSNLNVYMPKSKFWMELIYGNSYKVVAITKAMQKKIQNQYSGFDNITCIYNLLNIDIVKQESKENLDLEYRYVLAVGQLNTIEKQIDKLILAYSKSKLPAYNIHLVILGEGKRAKEFKELSVMLNVDNFVHILGYKNNPYKYMRSAVFLVLTSLYEGHPMVLIESLACGTPVVAFNCPTGPSEIISHRENGLLIEDQNIEELVEGINLLITDQELYSKIKNNAFKSVKKFDVESIGKQWLELLKIDDK